MNLSLSSCASTSLRPWGRNEFLIRLRECESDCEVGHPFQLRLNRGDLQPFQVRAWVANRFYYEANVPSADTAALTRCAVLARGRVGSACTLRDDCRAEPGDRDARGIHAWAQLAASVGLKAQDLRRHRHVRAGVRIAVDAFGQFVRRTPHEAASLSFLTALFSPTLQVDRLGAWPRLYPWIEPEGFAHFLSRIPGASPRLALGDEVAQVWLSTRTRQERAVAALKFRLDVLRSMLDVIEHAYPDDLPAESRP